jgi:hypothetical protein
MKPLELVKLLKDEAERCSALQPLLCLHVTDNNHRENKPVNIYRDSVLELVNEFERLRQLESVPVLSGDSTCQQ